MKLSIIIPYYNKEKYIHELLDCLDPQLTMDVEVIIVDDGSDKPLAITSDTSNIPFKNVKIFRKRNGGVSSARNLGIEKSCGEYISFIDADDLVSDTYVNDILSRIPFDYLEMSWKSLPGCAAQYDVKLNSDSDRLSNPSVCTRAFNRAFIGDLRFNENKDGAEDEEFTRKLNLYSGKRVVIPKYSYFYRTCTETSATSRYMSGGLNTKRIVYYYKHITPDMTWLLEEVKEEDKNNEVIILTSHNEIPELSMYARIQQPSPVRGMELRGEPTTLFSKIPQPIRTQVVLWTDTTFAIGGIETFIYDFCCNMKDYYDITVAYNKADIEQIARLAEIVQTVKNNKDFPIFCDTLIVNRITDKVPENIQYKQKIQMCHTCKIRPEWDVPEDNDKIVFVSEVARKSFNKKGAVINNLTVKGDVNKPLILLSATRLNSFEKGEKRMVEFAKLLRCNHINFIWFVFSETEIREKVEGIVCMKPTLNIQDYMSMADYVVQLSDSEAFCYTIVEALQMGVPVLTTPLDVLPEIGFEDGENGYILPYNMQCIDVNEIAERKLKGFKYKYDNKKRIKQWREILGDTTPLKNYEYKPVRVKVLDQYFDILRQEQMRVGSICLMLPDRAEELRMKGLVEYD